MRFWAKLDEIPGASVRIPCKIVRIPGDFLQIPVKNAQMSCGTAQVLAHNLRTPEHSLKRAGENPKARDRVRNGIPPRRSACAAQSAPRYGLCCKPTPDSEPGCD